MPVVFFLPHPFPSMRDLKEIGFEGAPLISCPKNLEIRTTEAEWNSFGELVQHSLQVGAWHLRYHEMADSLLTAGIENLRIQYTLLSTFNKYSRSRGRIFSWTGILWLS